MKFCNSHLTRNIFNLYMRRFFFGLVYVCLVIAMPLCASVNMCLVVTCWERADLLALVCGVYCEFVTWYPGSGVVLDCIDT